MKKELTYKDLAKKYCGKGNERILIISDLHAPYNHPDALPFLKALHKKHKFTRIISIGDEIDAHSVSFHSHDPNLGSPSDELTAARKVLQALHRMFPIMDIIKSNHGDLYERKMLDAGLPEDLLKSRNEIYQIDNGWKFHEDLVITLPNGSEVLLHHGLASNVLNASMRKGMSLIQGHFHVKFEIVFWRTERQLNFGMTVGCLIDRHSRAMRYAKNNATNAIIGCGGIIDSQPRLFPMKLNIKGGWNGEIP